MGFADSGLLHELDADPSHVGSGARIGRFNRRRAWRLVLQASCECTACGDPQRGLSAVQRQKFSFTAHRLSACYCLLVVLRPSVGEGLTSAQQVGYRISLFCQLQRGGVHLFSTERRYLQPLHNFPLPISAAAWERVDQPGFNIV